MLVERSAIPQTTGIPTLPTIPVGPSNTARMMSDRALGQKQTPGVCPIPMSSNSSSSGKPTGSDEGVVKSMPIHCIVEQVTPSSCDADGKGLKTHGSNGGAPVVELDTYAILPGSTIFSEIVRTALMKIGYTASEAVGAKGAVQIKHWKPLSFDTITENPNSTLDEILGDLTSFATLRIQLCSNSKVTALEEVKDKLLDFLLDRSQDMLTGCPIDKKLLTQISRGDYSASLPEGSRDAFNKWYKDHRQSTNQSSALTTPGIQHLAVPGAPSTVAQQKSHSPMPSTVSTFNSPPRFDNSFPFRSRARTSFDIENEIPRLQKWFSINQHPSREQMDIYLHELNSLDSRRGKKPLDLTNIIYWFKNARAALRRSSKCSPGGVDEAQAQEGQEDSFDDHSRATSPENVPVLPNRNAIYVVQPIHHQVDKIEVVHPQEDGDDMCDEDDDEDRPHKFSSHSALKSAGRNVGETNNNHVPMEQEEATDLSVHSQKDLGGLFRMKKEDLITARGPTQVPFRLKREECDSEFLSTSSSSPSPSPNSLGGLSASTQGLPLQSPHTALQMAAMSHALSMHYMHPAAALYQNSSAVQGFKDSSSLSPTSNESLSDRKKRSRVFIDPLSEIPKLEKWFEDDTHPSSYMIEKYTEELNRSAYRLRFPHLEPKNVQLWFKNHRAKVKRQRLGIDGMDGMDGMDGASPLMMKENDGLSPAVSQRGMSPATTQVS